MAATSPDAGVSARRERLIAAAHQLVGHAHELGLVQLAATVEEDVARRLSGGPLRVAVIGEVNHGKSSMINALVEQAVVPVGVIPTTSTLVRLCAPLPQTSEAGASNPRSSEPAAGAGSVSGTSGADVDTSNSAAVRSGAVSSAAVAPRYQLGDRTLSSEAFNALARGRTPTAWGATPDASSRTSEPQPANSQPANSHAAARPAADGVARLRVELHHPLLAQGIELVDTPGINDPDALQELRGRGELARADVVLLVLDATAAMNRTELELLSRAFKALGGEAQRAAVLVAINRVDMVPPTELPALRDHVAEAAAGYVDAATDLFVTDAKGALNEPTRGSAGVRGVQALRARLAALAHSREDRLPRRAATALRSHTSLVIAHASVARAAVALEQDAIDDELRRVQDSRASLGHDLAQLRTTLDGLVAQLLKEHRARAAAMQADLIASARITATHASLRMIKQHMAGAIHDAFLAFATQEAREFELKLREGSKQALRTMSDRAASSLSEHLTQLTFAGPQLMVQPPSLSIEAGLVAVGLAGTAVMYFGGMGAALAVTVAGPLATLYLRERSLQDARTQVTAQLPEALARSLTALDTALEASCVDFVQTIETQVTLAADRLSDDLAAVLRRARTLREHLGSDARAQLDERIHGLERLREQLESELTILVEPATRADTPDAAAASPDAPDKEPSRQP